MKINLNDLTIKTEGEEKNLESYYYQKVNTGLAQATLEH